MTSARKILVTGASRGLGLNIAEYLLNKGDLVIGCARSKSPLEHPNYKHYHLDVSSEHQVNELFFNLKQSFGHIDALINNAGIARMNAFILTPFKSMQEIMQVNFGGTFMCCQKAIGLLKKSASPRIINMSTVAVPIALEGEAAYAASKSAVETLTRILAKELSVFNITCNAIGPSPIATDLISGVSEDKIASLIAQQAIKKMAQPQDVINLIDFFLQPQSSMVTGQIIYLGGIS